MARITHAEQIDLRFGDLACEVLNFRVGARAGNLRGFRLLRTTPDRHERAGLAHGETRFAPSGPGL
jgi:hypothetical protein